MLLGHVSSKIHAGATRNILIRGGASKFTKQQIREDLEHIHNLVVVDFSVDAGNVLISLNSVNNALFARTCMMSRASYKGHRIEYYADDCAGPLPKVQYVPKQEPQAPVKKENKTVNRFQVLNIDGTDESDIASEDELTGFVGRGDSVG